MPENKKPRNKPQPRIPFVLTNRTFLAGSYLNADRGPDKPPQAPPQPGPSKPIELPMCPHGVKIAQEDWDLYQKVYEGHLRLNEANEAEPYPYFAKACAECHPFCAHGQELNEQEIAAAKSAPRLSAQCPVCTASTDPKLWNEFLRVIGFSEFRGMSPAVHYIPTSHGGVHAIGATKNFVRVGGSQQIEHTDAKRSREDMEGDYTTAGTAKGKPKGWGSGTYSDESNTVNELNEPVSTEPSKTISMGEGIRAREIRKSIENNLVDPTTETKGAKELLKPEFAREDGRGDMEVPEFDRDKVRLNQKDKRMAEEIMKEAEDKETPARTKDKGD